MADKGSNLFVKCATEFVHLCPHEEEYPSSSYPEGTLMELGIL